LRGCSFFCVGYVIFGYNLAVATEQGYTAFPDKISERVDLTWPQKAVLCWLARLQGDSGSCFPSYEYLAKVCGVGRRTVVRAVQDLRKKGEVKTLRMPYQSNTYAVPWATSRAIRKQWATQKTPNAKTKTG
jgi:DNA-binding MarR family transcriptional regulator